MNILIVDDLAVNRKLLRINLEGEGFTTFEAAEGEEALRVLARERIDCIVSDILMPGLDGMSLCVRVRQDERLRRTPFIAFTSTMDSASEEDLVKSAGVDRYITKPAPKGKLIATIRELLAPSAPAPVHVPATGVQELALAHEYSTAIARKLEERNTELSLLVAQLKERAALIDLDPDAIVVKDDAGRIVFWSQGAERLLGWPAEQAIGRIFADCIQPAPLERLVEARAALARGDAWEGELELLARDGRTIAVESRWSGIRGTVPRTLLVNRDLTEKKEAEKKYLRAQRMENLGALAGGIAHDLNNVLSPIMMATQLMRSASADPTHTRWLDIIDTSAQRGAAMIRQILSFARGSDTAKGPVQVRYVLQDLRGMVQNTFPAGIHIEADLSPDLWSVRADPTQIYQVLLNLCVNARDAMPRGGRLSLGARNFTVDETFRRMHRNAALGPHVAITVADTGVGISPEHLERVFEPFFTTKSAEQGTGLGLATVRQIVTSHGGFVTVQSAIGQGTSFQINLPAVPGDVNDVTLGFKAAANPSLPPGRGELLLLADDEASVREITKATLEAFGYRVLTSGDGTEAVARFAENRAEVALLLTDMQMPLMDGLSTIRALRNMRADLLVIAASGLATSRAALDSAGVKVQGFIEKPYTADRLLREIGRVLHPLPA